jgi:integrase
MTNRPRRRPPGYLLHKATGQARVRLNGRDVYLGMFGSQESKERYFRLLAEQVASPSGATPSELTSDAKLTVTELLARYWRFAEKHYSKHGRPTGQVRIVRDSIRPLRQLYGSRNVGEFSCRELKTVRSEMLSTGRLCRTEINRRIGVIRHIFRWGVSESFVPAGVMHSLRELLPLQRGRCEAHEAKPVTAVDDAVVEATIPFLPPVLQDVVRIQRLTGCRPGEVLQMRPADVERSGDVWVFRPASHKSEHHGKDRLIILGPKAQAILSPYLLRTSTMYCFSPAESESKRKLDLRARRQTRVQPSQTDRKTPSPKKRPRDYYDRHSYGHAIRRAVETANRKRLEQLALQLKRTPTGDEAAATKLPYWHANQLRHAAATEIRSAAGLDVAAAVLGHSRPDTTLIYAEHDLAKATNIMRRIG